MQERDGSTSLTGAEEGEEYIVMAIPEGKNAIRRLLSLGILPGSKIRVGGTPSFGAVMVQRGDDELALSQSVASQIFVRQHDGRSKRKHHGRFGRKSKRR